MAVAGNHTTDARLMCAVQGERHTCIGKPRQGGKASPIIAIMNRGCARLFLIAALLAGGDVVLAQARTQKIAGDIVRVDGLQLEVKTAAGQAVTVKLADNFRLSVRSAADAT